MRNPSLLLPALVAMFPVATFSLRSATQVGSAPYAASVTGAGNSHAPVFSADGKHVAFVSHANNLVTNDDKGPHLDLFVRDLVTSNTVLVSISTNGFGGANDNIGLYTLSSNAQFIAFDTDANNLAAGDTNRWSDIYIRDLESGATRLITPGANGSSSNPLISEDGRRVIFESLASNLVTNDFNGTNDIFVHDLTTGMTELVSVNSSGTASGNGASHSPAISADGLTVAFVSHATNLVEGVTNALGEVYARELAQGTTRWAVASHIPATHDGFLSTGTYQASEPVISRDGRFVAFKTSGQVVRFDLHQPTNSVILGFTNNLVSEPYTAEQRFHDNPRLGRSTTRAPLLMSADGRYLASGAQSNQFAHTGIFWTDFESLETNWFAAPPLGGAAQGVPHFTTNISPVARMVVTNFDFNSASPLPTRSITIPLAISQDGLRIVFLANPTNEVTSYDQMTLRLFMLDLPDRLHQLSNTNQSVSMFPNLSGTAAALSVDGILLAWDSPEANLVAGDLNGSRDVFLRNLVTGETTVISARHPDLPDVASHSSSRLELTPRSLSADGRKLAFLSFDGNQAPNDTNRLRDVFVRNLNDDTTLNASMFPRGPRYYDVDIGSWPSLSANGRYLVFSGDRSTGDTIGSRKIFWRDLQSSTNRMVFWPGYFSSSQTLGPSAPILDYAGRLIAFHASSVMDTNYTDPNGTYDVFVSLVTPHPVPECELPAAQAPPLFISSASGTNITANGPSQNPVFSPDSQWVVFQSMATNLLPNALPVQTVPQLYARRISIETVPLPGCETGAERLAFSPTRLISFDTATPLPGGATNPVFSADSRFVFFEGFTSNAIYRHDLLDQVGGLIGSQSSLFFCTDCINPSPSGDGGWLAYESPARSNVVHQIFVRDQKSGSNELVSVSLSGTDGNGSSFSPSLSQDARFVVFASRASDLVPGDNNRATDIFVRDRWARVTHCLSRNLAGTGTGNRVSSNPILSADGRTVAFQSFASDLVAGDYNDTRDVFVVTLGGPDNDGDGMEDDWEAAYFNTLARDGSGDFDNDGASDLDEFRAGTNPVNDASILRVLRLSTGIAQGSAQARATVILWQAVPGRTYRVETKPDLDLPWVPAGAEVVATGTTASVTHEQDASGGENQRHGFYRVVLVQ